MRAQLAFHAIITEKKMIKYISCLLLLSTMVLSNNISETEKITGRVTYFTADQVYCDLGANNQIIIGDTLDVSRRAEILGVLIVSHVANKSSVSEILTPEIQFKLGDLVRELDA